MFDKFIFELNFVEGLLESIRHSMRSYWSSKNTNTFHELAHHVTSQTKILIGSNDVDAPDNSEKRELNVGIVRTGSVRQMRLSQIQLYRPARTIRPPVHHLLPC